MKVINVQNPSSVNMFNKMIKERDALVKIYNDYCGHCNELKPVWSKFVKNIKNKPSNMFIANINSDVLSELDMDTNILGVPTIRYIQKKSGKKIRDYEGHRTVNDLMRFYNKINKAKSIKKNHSKKRNHSKKPKSKRHKTMKK